MTELSLLITSLQKQLANLPAQQKNLIESLITEGTLHHQKSWASHMTPAVDEPALFGQLLAGIHNGNLLSSELYPQLVTIKQQLLNWFCQLFQQPFAHFTHGSTYANLEALWQAREKSSNDSKLVYGSQAAHYSIVKACQILGLDFQAIPTNALGQMHVDQLQQACEHAAPVAVVVTAGSSSCGAIDPISDCVNIAQKFNAWCHIDAAWGGALILIAEQKHLLTGIQQADSVCFDPHKALGQPRPCSVLLYQQPLDSLDVDYLLLPQKQTLLGSYGGELFLPLWCSLLLSGEQLLIDQLQQRLHQAEYFYRTLKQHSDWWCLHSPSGIVCFTPSKVIDLQELITQGVLSQAKINNQHVYRVVFASATTQADALLTVLEPYF